MSGVDRMAVIAHKQLECPTHGADSVARWASGKRTCWRCREVPVEVEYVPADQLRGAVEAFEEIARERYVDHRGQITGEPSHAALIAKRWLTTHRGQSDAS